MSDLQVFHRKSQLELYPSPEHIDTVWKSTGKKSGKADYSFAVATLTFLVPDGARTEIVEVVEMLQGGHDAGTQVLRIKDVDNNQGTETHLHRVLKIYNAAFFETLGRMPKEYGAWDAMFRNFETYIHLQEYVAREDVQRNDLHTGVMNVIPKLHSRVLVKVAKEDSTESRYVPAYVVEYVEGTCMKNLLVAAFSDEERGRILNAVLKAWARILTAGIVPRSTEPSHVIIRNEFSDDPPVMSIELNCDYHRRY